MGTYVVLRRRIWRDLDDVELAVERVRAAGMANNCAGATWVRSYIVEEPLRAGLGSVCVVEAISSGAVARHSHAADLAYSEILPVADRMIERPDWRVRMV